jgi:hypothetical protein
MSRSFIAILLAVVCSSCVSERRGPDIWSLSVADANSNEIYLGGHYTLDACREAGMDWFTGTKDHGYVLQCRLNCRKLTMPNSTDSATMCEATEPVG